jgi:hypothetical protein
MDAWRQNLLEDEDQILSLLDEVKRVAVIGIKTEDFADQASFYVPKYLVGVGVEVVPVPVYFPEVTHILERSVYRRVSDIPGEVDLVNVFRRPKDVPGHVEDILAKKPKAVWLQLDIRHDESAERWARAGIKVVQDRCLMVDHRLWRRRRPA